MPGISSPASQRYTRKLRWPISGTSIWEGKWDYFDYCFPCYYYFIGFDSNSIISRKTPDAAVFLQGRKWPTIALEVGYSEPYDELLEDADLLLEGSEGRIGIVIVVKLQPLGSGDTAIGSGFVELHKFNESTQKRIRLGGRRVSHLLSFSSMANCP